MEGSGRLTLILVPLIAVEVMSKLPPSSAVRSRIEFSPSPMSVPRSDGSPRPSSCTLRSSESPHETLTDAHLAFA